MSLSITKKPLLPVIAITKNDDTTYTYNPHTPTFDFRLKSLQFKPAYDHVGGSFSMTIYSSDASNANMNTFLSNVDEGNELTISLGKTSSVTLLFRGIIERKEIIEPVRDLMEVTLSGPDWGSYILKSKLINRSWIQDRTGDDLNESDDSTLVSQIIDDMITETASSPTQEYSLTDLGVVYSSSNITVPDVKFPEFIANMEYADDKLTEIDNLIGTTHYIDPSKNLIIKDPTISSSSSGILLSDDFTSATALAWDQTKLGLIAPGSTYVRTLENHKRRIFGLGGDRQQVDQSSTSYSTSTTVYDKYIAMRFSPQYIPISQIAIVLSKTGSPSSGPSIQLVEDYGGEPTGTVLRDTVRASKDEVTASANWHWFDIGEELNTSKNYWIILNKTGDVSNTYNWHRDSNDTGTHSTSSDLVTWTPASTPNRWNFTFKTYTSTPILTVFSDSADASSKHFVEHVIKQPDITTQEQMNRFVISEASRLFKRKELFSTNIYAPDTLLQTGQTIQIDKMASGYQIDNISFTVSDVDYVFEADDTGVTGQMYYNIEAFRYTEY
jgi:hypothetical protein